MFSPWQVLLHMIVAKQQTGADFTHRDCVLLLGGGPEEVHYDGFAIMSSDFDI
jgi:hypothetical protein